ncbi:class I SAM-dependent methyltransferase [Flammeovirgaceae bacterium SG7u.111]|nr:class I SAM-dependent methyltransferase [Flammeovirgaceae bacterium SG7u.132]WPO33458.1 class I SAM-dependent methyltransferase [Flammeovirgaceae bacterium SG7u.111]
MGKLFTISSYLRYLRRAKNEHSLHSPFLFELYTQVIRPAKKYYVFDRLTELKFKLSDDRRQIEVTDFGAGSRTKAKKTRSVRSIAKVSVSPTATSQLLFKLVERFQPKTMIELGTSLGVNSLYMQAPISTAKLYTFEGCPNIAQVAKDNFEWFGLSPEIIKGNIDETLPAKLSELEKLDFVFFDANHRYEPTLNYFAMCLEKAHEDSVFVFDDIYWSEEMAKVWEEIKSHAAVTLSLDLFEVGIVFFRKKQPKQHFVLKF